MSKWEASSLGEICNIYQPKTISKKEMIDDGIYPVFGANGVIGRYNKYNHDTPQLLITCRGATCGSVNITEGKSWITGNAMVIAPKDNRINLHFIKYFFLGAIDISKVISGTAQPQITRQNLAPTIIKYPRDIQEQKRIVALLDQIFADIDKARAIAEKNLQNARDLFDSYLEQVFSQGGDNWLTINLKAITSKIGSGATPTGGKASYKKSGVSLIRSMNVHDRRFKDKDLAFIDDAQAEKLSNVEINQNDVLLNITGASVARCCIAPESYLPARVNQHVSIIRVHHNTIKPKLLCYLLTSMYYKNILLGIGEAGSTRQAITKTQIENFEVSFPECFGQQDLLIKKFNELEDSILLIKSIYRQKLNSLEELKKSILQKAFTGELTKSKGVAV